MSQLPERTITPAFGELVQKVLTESESHNLTDEGWQRLRELLDPRYLPSCCILWRIIGDGWVVRGQLDDGRTCLVSLSSLPLPNVEIGFYDYSDSHRPQQYSTIH